MNMLLFLQRAFSWNMLCLGKSTDVTKYVHLSLLLKKHNLKFQFVKILRKNKNGQVIRVVVLCTLKTLLGQVSTSCLVSFRLVLPRGNILISPEKVAPISVNAPKHCHQENRLHRGEHFQVIFLFEFSNNWKERIFLHSHQKTMVIIPWFFSLQIYSFSHKRNCPEHNFLCVVC